MRTLALSVAWVLIDVAALTLFATAAFAQQMAAQSVNEPQQLIQYLRGTDDADRQMAIHRIHEFSQNPPRESILAAKDLLAAMLDAKDYSDVEPFALAVIKGRPHDPTAVDIAEKSRVLALLASEKFPDALAEAKGYYNVALLTNTAGAIDLVAQALQLSGDPAAAIRFKMQQAATSSPTSQSPATQPSGNQTEESPVGAPTVLSSIKVNAAPYKSKLGSVGNPDPVGPVAYTKLMGRGNLLLLSDRAAEAQTAFGNACRAADPAHAKDLHEAVEGVARSIRAQSGTVAPANAFISALRKKDLSVSNTLVGNTGSVSVEDFAAAAQATRLAETGPMVGPPLEQQRQQTEAASPADSGVQIDTQFEGAPAEDVRRISSTHFEVTLRSQFHDWFMFSVTGANGKAVRIDVTDPDGQIGKWATLNPVYSYVPDLDDPDTFATSQPKAQGPQEAAQELAWNGSILPATDGQKWHFINGVWRQSGNTISMVQQFESNFACVAMRVPHTPGYNEHYFHSLAGNPRVSTIEIGRSTLGRPLLLAEIGSASIDDQKKNPCLLVYAGEHADEQDAMWAAQGVIEHLIGDDPQVVQLRGKFTFLVVPQLDPDASFAGAHSRVITSFLLERKSIESSQYANWFRAWVDAGKRLDLVLDLHNIQSSEGPHVACALLEGLGTRGTASMSLHQLVVKNLQAANFSVEPRPWMRGWSPDRLGGWLSHCFGPITLAYEINSQDAQRHLDLAQLKAIGGVMSDATGQFFDGPDGKTLLAEVDSKRRDRTSRLAESPTTASSDAISAEENYLVAPSGAATQPELEKYIP